MSVGRQEKSASLTRFYKVSAEQRRIEDSDEQPARSSLLLSC